MSDISSTKAWETLRHRKSELREIPLSELAVDSRFQRALNPNAVNRIKEEYHPQGIGHLVVARITVNGALRAGWTVIDGQTRWKALEELQVEVAEGRRHVPDLAATVRAEAFDELTVPEAALLFRLRNAQRPVPPKDRDRIMVTEGDPTMVQVVEQAAAAGYRVFPDDDDNPPTMPYVDVAKRIVRWGHRYNRPELLTEALNVQAQAFGTELGSVDKQVLGATADLLRKNPNLDDAGELVRVMSAMGLPGVRGQSEAMAAKIGKRMHGAIQLVLVQVYNKGKRRDEKIRY